MEIRLDKRHTVGFNPREEYPAYEGMGRITEDRHAYNLARISNLIVKMIVDGANEDELGRAIRHSMVVIDSHKYNLDYERSAVVEDIEELSMKYQKN